MSEEPNLVEVEWAGRKLFLHQDKLEEWHAKSTDQQKVQYINTHPGIREPVSVHRMEERDMQNPDDLVLVMWYGHKLLLEREQLDEWYHSSFEAHRDFVKRHPAAALKN
jgi:hypothetical protein